MVLLYKFMPRGIAYSILQLVDIPQIWGSKLLDIRYLQACMCQEIS
jgi:hypothetical protein